MRPEVVPCGGAIAATPLDSLKKLYRMTGTLSFPLPCGGFEAGKGNESVENAE
jgi:hypothetical protein